MRTWTATASAEAHPEAVLHVLTDPDAASRWAPVPFDVEVHSADVNGLALTASGRVEVHSADVNGLALTASGPVEFDVDYRLAPTTAGSQVHASISVRPQRGLSRLTREAALAL